MMGSGTLRALAALLSGAMNEAALWVAGPDGDLAAAQAALGRLLEGLRRVSG